MRGAAHAAVLHGAAQCWDEIPPTFGQELGPGVAWEWHDAFRPRRVLDRGGSMQ